MSSIRDYCPDCKKMGWECTCRNEREQRSTDRDEPEGTTPIHRHGCDCMECWIGYSVSAPKPPSLFDRVRSAATNAWNAILAKGDKA